jgi:N-carbamoyl-L-amino-acid hydrolase
MTYNARLEADQALALRLFDTLLELSRDDPGVTRDAYGEGEERAHRLVLEVADELGLHSECDPAGNLFLTMEGTDATLPPWIVGSHLDSVPHGGNFGGAAGVLGGLAAVLSR